MAIANMTHLRLVGLRSKQKRIVDKLASRGLFEARATEVTAHDLGCGNMDGLCDSLKLKQSKIAFALDFLKTRHATVAAAVEANERDVKKGKAESLGITVSKEKYSNARTLITRADFSDARAREYELLDVCDNLQKISFELSEDKSRAQTLNNGIKTYAPFAAVPLKLSALDRDGDVRIFLFHDRSGAPVESALDAIPCAYEVLRGDGVAVLVICRAAASDEAVKSMSALGYTRCTLNDDCTAEQKIAALRAELCDVERHMFALNVKALEYEKFAGELRILYDVLGLEIECAVAERDFLQTDQTFILEGWLPESVAQSVTEELKAEYPEALIQLLAPEERDEPPTLVCNNKVVAPYEEITNMYSPPRYKEIDPNPIMSVFYFLFFGIMIGDAGYGLILAVAGLVIGNCKKFDAGIRRLALLVGMGGISAIIWGVLFGGYFSIDFGETNVALILNPLDKPLLLLVMSIAFGCVQIVTGFVIKFVALCKDGKPFSAIFDCGSIILLFAALICLVVGMLPSLAPMLGISVDFTPPSSLKTAAAVLAIAGVALILVFGGRNSKNVFGKIVGGFKGLYGLVNILSDLLSYCRLFGLCLASCAIGLAFNSLGGIIMGIPAVGYVVGAVVLAVLHTFNLALGVLSAYVHDARLQFLEFYGKFYDGGGRLFAPLGQKTKYVRYS